MPVSQFWQITSTFKYQLLIWIGIVGSAITVFGGLSVILDFADWAKQIATYWHELTQVFWTWVFGWVGIKVPKVLAPLISFTVFAALLVAGVNLSVRSEREALKPQHEMTRKIGTFVGGLVLYFAIECLGLLG